MQIKPTDQVNRYSITEEFYRMIAEANVTMTTGGSGTLFNSVKNKGGFVILALGGVVQGTTWRGGTTFTVPTGKIAVCVDMRFEGQTIGDPTYYKHRLYNTTASTCKVGPNTTMTGTGADSAKAQASYSGNNFPVFPSNTVNTNIALPVQVGVAGDVIRAEIAGGSDGNSRNVFGMYILAIIDATTKLMEPITS